MNVCLSKFYVAIDNKMHGIYANSMNIITFNATEQKLHSELWNEEF